MRILIVEDNPKMAAAILNGLAEHNYVADVCTNGAEGEEAAAQGVYDVIVLDLMLPDRHGLEICRNLRRRGVQAPILVLSALSGTAEKITGLDAGADDYLTKPFEFEELVARIRALMRRGQATESSTLTYNDLTLDLRKRCAARGGESIRLSSKEFGLLEYLMRNPNRVLTRATIAEKVWDMNYEPSSNVIDVYISTLRGKIDRNYERPLIHTVIGAGYRFGEPVG